MTVSYTHLTSEQLNMHRRADGDYKKVASFVAVLPANDPEILVYVMLDDPNNARDVYKRQAGCCPAWRSPDRGSSGAGLARAAPPVGRSGTRCV